MKLEGIRYVFRQDIYRASDMKLAARGKVDVVCLVGGKLSRCPELEEKLKLKEEVNEEVKGEVKPISSAGS